MTWAILSLRRAVPILSHNGDSAPASCKKIVLWESVTQKSQSIKKLLEHNLTEGVGGWEQIPPLSTICPRKLLLLEPKWQTEE